MSTTIDISDRITNDNIESLLPGQVFVFGSNRAGYHGAGAAAFAREKLGAVMGVGEGVTGQCYAIPTKDSKIDEKSKHALYTLSIEDIGKHVNTFVEYAKAHPEQIFLVTEIGCGLAGHSAFDIAPLFLDVVELPNVHLPKKFWRMLQSVVRPACRSCKHWIHAVRSDQGICDLITDHGKMDTIGVEIYDFDDGFTFNTHASFYCMLWESNSTHECGCGDDNCSNGGCTCHE